MSTIKKPALGRGLSALLQDNGSDIMNKEHPSRQVGSISMIPLSQIEANPFQPRTAVRPARQAVVQGNHPGASGRFRSTPVSAGR